jgi:hypothetical protein
MATGTVSANVLADRIGPEDKVLFIDLVNDQLSLDLMEYRHVAGWAALERRSIPNWTAFVSELIQQAIGVCREPDPRLLLEVGQTRRANAIISISDVAEHLVASYPWLEKASLVIISPSAHLLGETIANALTVEALEASDTGKMWVESMLKPQDRLPYSLVVFAVDAKNPLHPEMGIKPLTRLVAGTPLLPDRPISDQITFYTQPGTPFVVIRLAGRSPANPNRAEELGSYRIENPPAEMTLLFTIQHPSPLPIVRIGNTTLLPMEPEEVRRVGLPGVTQRNAALDLMFIIDATMLPEDYEQALTFVKSIGAKLDNMDVRMAAIAYGEHEHPRGFWDKPPFVTLQIPFGSYAGLEHFLDQVQPFDLEHDFADALEVGLADAARAAWSDRSRCVVIIGNSPPHGRAKEQEKFGTLNVSTEELTNIDWRVVVKKLKSNGTQIATIWVPPTHTSASSNDLKYAQSLWRVIGEFFFGAAPDETVHDDLMKKLLGYASSQQTLDGSINWPLIAPWQHKG